jgi:hypothetical protein
MIPAPDAVLDPVIGGAPAEQRRDEQVAKAKEFVDKFLHPSESLLRGGSHVTSVDPHDKNGSQRLHRVRTFPPAYGRREVKVPGNTTRSISSSETTEWKSPLGDASQDRESLRKVQSLPDNQNNVEDLTERQDAPKISVLEVGSGSDMSPDSISNIPPSEAASGASSEVAPIPNADTTFSAAPGGSSREAPENDSVATTATPSTIPHGVVSGGVPLSALATVEARFADVRAYRAIEAMLPQGSNQPSLLTEAINKGKQKEGHDDITGFSLDD